jgi:putative cardiolipin synthase
MKQRSQIKERPGRAPAFAYDLPDKVTTAPEDRATHLIPQLRPIIDSTKCELVIVSPDFVPGKEGVAFFRRSASEACAWS